MRKLRDGERITLRNLREYVARTRINRDGRTFMTSKRLLQELETKLDKLGVKHK